jgi:hypothetical protein
MSEIKKPMFKPGDIVAIKDEVNSSEIALELSNHTTHFLDVMFKWKKNFMKVSGTGKALSSSEPQAESRSFWCRVEENDWHWNENWLRLITEAEKPRFKTGDWVKLKDDIKPFGTKDEIILWKNKFMKVNNVVYVGYEYRYHVKDNIQQWPESWLDKVE